MPIIELMISVTEVIVLLEHLLAPTASATGEEDGKGIFFSKKLAWIYKKGQILKLLRWTKYDYLPRDKQQRDFCKFQWVQSFTSEMETQ